MNTIDLRRLATPRFFLVHQNRAQRLRVHALDDAGGVGVECADDARPVTVETVLEMLATDSLTHVQTNDPEMVRYLEEAWVGAGGQLPCRVVHIDTDLPILDDW